MNTLLKNILPASAVLLLVASVLSVFWFGTVANGAGGSGADDPVFAYATSSSVYVGKDIPTVVAQYSKGRSYLEITNLSGATSTPNMISCAVGVAPVLYKGITIFASSTRSWGRDQSVPVGQIRCIAAGASSTIAILEK